MAQNSTPIRNEYELVIALRNVKAAKWPVSIKIEIVMNLLLQFINNPVIIKEIWELGLDGSLANIHREAISKPRTDNK